MHTSESTRVAAPSSSLPVLLRQGLLVAAALLAVPGFVATPAHAASSKKADHPKAAKAKPAAAKKSHAASAHGGRKAGKAVAGKHGGKAVAKKSSVPDGPGPLADFGKTQASPEVVHVANWVSYTHDNGPHSFVVIDKKLARLYLFTPQGKLKGDTPVLLGMAVGDTTAPNVGNLPLSKIPDDQKTTPAGRFLVERGLNTHHDDVFWIDYKAAISMHRMHSMSAAERRAERMATPDPKDNRISNGCVNLPPQFYNALLKPTLMRQGAVVYVLPETRTPQQLFGSYDVPGADKRVQLARR